MSGQACTIPLSYFKKMLPYKECTATNKEHIYQPQWIPPEVPRTNNTLHIHHTTTGKAYPTRFCIFIDTKSPPILISHAASDRLDILHSNLLRETNASQIDTITTQANSQKHITFSTTNTVIPLYKTIHHRTLPSKTINMPPSKTIIPIPLTQDHSSLMFKTITLEPTSNTANNITVKIQIL